MWNTRRSASACADRIQDGAERLQQVLKRNHCLGNGIEQVTRQLPEMSITNINALIDRTENSIQVLELLLEVAKTQKKLAQSRSKVRKICLPLILIVC